jgi:hypothetical protein
VLDRDGGRVWLVGPGKHGAEAMLAHLPDGPVTVRGKRIERGGMQMFEVVEAHGAAAAGEARRDSTPRSGATVTLRGEIVDSKCFLGVMNPGEGAVHRDCARRCLSGGIPPMLLVRDGAGREQLVALVSRSGGRIPELAGLAGSAAEVSGALVRDGREYVLYVERWQQADAN